MGFCSGCGKKLVVKKKTLDSYEEKTGKPQHLYTVACPDETWWTIFKSHTRHEYLVCVKHILPVSKEEYTVVLERC